MPKNTQPPLAALIGKRQSKRVFDSDKQISPEIIRSLLEAARWVPSSNNRQPWFFLIFDDRVSEKRDQARDCLTRGNAYAWTAPVLILSIAEEVNLDGKNYSNALHDLGLANENLMLQAITLGLNCRPMGGFDKDKARTYFSIPQGYSPVILIAIGYPPPLLTIPPGVIEEDNEARTRKPMEEIAYLGSWSLLLSEDK
jgi:nitroreductase